MGTKGVGVGMNQTIDTIKKHRTIRAYKNIPVEDVVIAELLEVARRTSTSTGLQRASIIRVTDLHIREQLSNLCQQKYVLDVPEFWVFIVDTYRNRKISEEKGFSSMVGRDMDRFFQGFSDCLIMAQNVLVAVESLGMGGALLGNIHNDSQKVIDLLKLPKYTFPAIALAFGYPDQEPQIKPRMEMNLRCFENSYRDLSPYLETFKEYDEQMQEYYDLREANKRVDSFTNQIVTKDKLQLSKRRYLLDVIEKQGFILRGGDVIE